nr:NADP-dependent phosphogluconate dehydrogenase [uncultured Dysosmobacter sp.]
MKYQIGVAGLAVMGRGLALNLAEHGFAVAGYNRSSEPTEIFVEAGKAAGYTVTGCATLEEFCSVLEKPRKILLMVKAGAAVDAVLEGLMPYLEPGDIVIDGGNSHYPDTVRRHDACAQKNINFMGLGVSGGEEGARHGPALMPGGDKDAYAQVEKFLTTIAAHVGEDPCCAYIGPGGAGHFVKMTHNGIEYGDMELICEAYYLMRKLLGMSAAEIAEQFKAWNEGELSSYLVDITAHILTVQDPETGNALVDMIAPIAGSKGTGMWTVQEALALGVPLPTIAQAVFARDLSAKSDERTAAKERYGCEHAPFTGSNRAAFLEAIRQALYASKICSYAQGFALLKTASERYDWNLDLGGIALLFRGGCIIRAAFLERIAEAYRAPQPPANLLMDDYFAGKLAAYQPAWRQVVTTAAASGVAAPAFSASLAYFDGYRDAEGPMNLLQAQRDCFGAHTYRRTDKEGSFHFDWLG